MKKQAPIALGNRRELFIDSYLVDTAIGAAQRLNPPQRREVVLKMDQPDLPQGQESPVQVRADRR